MDSIERKGINITSQLHHDWLVGHLSLIVDGNDLGPAVNGGIVVLASGDCWLL